MLGIESPFPATSIADAASTFIEIIPLYIPVGNVQMFVMKEFSAVTTQSKDNESKRRLL